MEPDGLSSLVPRSAANQGLFGFVLFFLQFPQVYCYSWVFLRRYWDLSPLASMPKDLGDPSGQRRGCEDAACGPGLNDSWPLAGPGGNPVLLCSGLEWFCCWGCFILKLELTETL